MIDVYTLDTHFFSVTGKTVHVEVLLNCLLYTSDAADE